MVSVSRFLGLKPRTKDTSLLSADDGVTRRSKSLLGCRVGYFFLLEVSLQNKAASMRLVAFGSLRRDDPPHTVGYYNAGTPSDI